MAEIDVVVRSSAIPRGSAGGSDNCAQLAPAEIGPRPPRVSRVTLRQTTPSSERAGLLGFVSFVLEGAILLDGVALRRTADGRPTLSFPARRDRCGREHPYIVPLGRDARATIEQQVFEALAMGPGGTP